MEFKNIASKTSLIFIFGCFSWLAAAQTESNEIELLQGTWLLESSEATLHSTNESLSIGIDNVSPFDVYPEIEIKQGTATLLCYDDEKKKTDCVIDSTQLKFNFPDGAFIAEWTIFEDKLYLEHHIAYPIDASGSFDALGKITVLLIYGRK